MSEGRCCINTHYRQKLVTNDELIENPDRSAIGRLCVLSPTTEENGEHLVSFVVGAGLVYTAPLSCFRVATPDERFEVAKGYFHQPWAAPYQIAADDPGWWDGSDPKTWPQEEES